MRNEDYAQLVTERYIGCIECIVGGNVVIGWAIDTDHIDSALDVELLVDDVLAASAPADKFRPDVAGIIGGDGRCGFEIRLDDSVLADCLSISKHVTARILKEKALPLWGSLELHPDQFAYNGEVYSFDCGVVEGRCIDTRSRDRALVITVYVGSTIVAVGCTKPHANGHFSLVLEGQWTRLSSSRLHVFVANTRYELVGSPVCVQYGQQIKSMSFFKFLGG